MAFEEPIDFKTSEIKSEHISLYTRQLHAYAYALENAALGKLSLRPITKLGIICVEPNQILKEPSGRIYYAGDIAWIEFERNNSQFMQFLGQVLDVIEQKEMPPSSPSCMWCQYRGKAKNIGL